MKYQKFVYLYNFISIVYFNRDTPYISRNTCDHKDKRSSSADCECLRLRSLTQDRLFVSCYPSSIYTYIWRDRFHELTYSHVLKSQYLKSPLSSLLREWKKREKCPKCENRVTSLNSVGKRDIPNAQISRNCQTFLFLRTNKTEIKIILILFF